MGKSSSGMPERVAALLCYVLVWVSGLVFLIIEKRSSYVRHHAILSTIVFGAISIAIPVIEYTYRLVNLPTGSGMVIGIIIYFGSIALWIILMTLASLGITYGKHLENS